MGAARLAELQLGAALCVSGDDAAASAAGASAAAAMELLSRALDASRSAGDLGAEADVPGCLEQAEARQGNEAAARCLPVRTAGMCATPGRPVRRVGRHDGDRAIRGGAPCRATWRGGPCGRGNPARAPPGAARWRRGPGGRAGAGAGGHVHRHRAG